METLSGKANIAVDTKLRASKSGLSLGVKGKGLWHCKHLLQVLFGYVVLVQSPEKQAKMGSDAQAIS